MKNYSNRKGMSAIIIVLFIAGIIIVLFSSLGNIFNSLNKTANDLRYYSDNLSVAFDMGQMINNAYRKAQATSSTIPPSCDGQSTAVAVGSTYLCLPNANFCSQFNSTFCLARPFVVTDYKNSEEPPEFVVMNQWQRHPSRLKWPLLLSPSRAWAQSVPAPWLPDVSGSPLTLTIATPTCMTTTAVNIDCIRCEGPSKNAHCIKVRFCKNGTSTCLTENQWTEPTFAVQLIYGP